MPAKRFTSRACAICKTVFWPRRDSQRYCSNSCSAKARGPKFYRRMGKKGGSTSGHTKRMKLLAALGDQVSHLTPLAAFLAGARWQTRRLGSGLGRRKFTEGYQAGWDACVEQFGLDASPRIRAKALAVVADPPPKPSVKDAQDSFYHALKEAV